MYDDIRQTGNPQQAAWLIEIGNDRSCTSRTPSGALVRVAYQSENPVMTEQAGEHPACNVTAADDQEFLHGTILPESENVGDLMGFQVIVQPSGQRFQADPDETLLEAGLRQGLDLPHSCRDGICGACRGKILSGRVDHGRAPVQTLSSADRQKGFALFCCALPRSDLCLSSRESLPEDPFIPARTFPARIHRLTRVAPEVMIVELQLPGNEPFLFLPGQHIEILLKDGRRRAFSMANAPNRENRLQLHVRHVPGGQFTTQVFQTMKERDLLRLRGPLGTFFLREDPHDHKAMLLVAGGTGFAPIKAMVEYALSISSTRAMHIYWGARDADDLYLRDLAEQWSREHAHIQFTPVLSGAPSRHIWSGRTGLVHLAAMSDHPDLSDYQVYVCGPPEMVAASRRDFLAHGRLPEEEFFADSFAYAADTILVHPVTNGKSCREI